MICSNLHIASYRWPTHHRRSHRCTPLHSTVGHTPAIHQSVLQTFFHSSNQSMIWNESNLLECWSPFCTFRIDGTPSRCNAHLSDLFGKGSKKWKKLRSQAQPCVSNSFWWWPVQAGTAGQMLENMLEQSSCWIQSGNSAWKSLHQKCFLRECLNARKF